MEENNNPMPQGGESKKKTSNLIIGILGIIVLILLFSWLDGGQETTDEYHDETEDTVEEMGSDEEASEPSSMNFEGISPFDWELTERAEGGVATLTSGQEIEFSIIEDPTDENVVYFATSAYDERDDQQMIGIYSYRTDNFNFERLFRRSYDKGDLENIHEEDFPDFHVVGYDSGNLVLLVMGMSDSPGPCAEPLLLGADYDGRELWSMSVDDPYGGFEDYELSEELRAEVEADQEACVAEL